MNNKKCYGPFQLWVLNNFPFTIDDWDSITQYQILCKCLGALKEQLDVNSDLYKKISDLENLDLQDEVNNKIDEMAESGQLQEIITEYLQINGVLGYDTVSDMVSATNIINGSICRTLGLNTYNDGKGAFYKVRTITSDDTVDGVNIIALDISNTLIAEKMPDYNISNLQSQINTINDEISNIGNRKFLFIGDSYGAISNDWITKTANNLGLTLNTDYFKVAEGSCGFLGDPNITGDKTFLRLLNEVSEDITNKNEITDIIIGGGVNDKTYTSGQIQTAISTFMTTAKTLYPNAKIALGMISWSSTSSYLAELTKVCSAYSVIASYGGCYINNSEYAFRFSGFLTDAVHPNSSGQTQIANCITNYIKTGVGVESFGQPYTATITGSNGFTAGYGELISSQKNNIINVSFKCTFTHSSSTSMSYNGTYYEIGSFTDTWFCGSEDCVIPVKAYVINANNERYTRSMLLKFSDKKLYIAGFEKTGTSTSDLTEYEKLIQVLPVTFTIPALGN